MQEDSMDYPIPVTEDIYWIGVNDRETDLFEAMWPLPNGISYNSYLIADDRPALVDTVKKDYLFPYLEKVRSLIGNGKSIEYLIINHMEPDHSGSILAMLEAFPSLRIVGNKKTLELLQGYYGITERVMAVEDGAKLDLGRHKLRFFMTPMVHWPETMMTFDEKAKVLFSGDAFGGFGALDGGIFDDEIDIARFEYEILRYYANIVGKFSQMVQNALKKLAGVDPAIIASTHGPIWRENPRYIIDAYDRMSRYEAETGAVVVYGSMYTNTKKMAEAAARGLAEGGLRKVKVHNLSHSHPSYILADIWGNRGVILGCCTYELKMFPLMEFITAKLEGKMLKNRTLGIFGSFGWSGGAVKELRGFADRVKWDLVEPVVESRCAPSNDALEQCRALGRNMAAKLLA